MTVFTGRRYYFIRLVPDPTSCIPILSFRFLDDEAEAILPRLEADDQAEAEAAAIAASTMRAVTARTGVPVDIGDQWVRSSFSTVLI